jgi:hypothetical protein
MLSYDIFGSVFKTAADDPKVLRPTMWRRSEAGAFELSFALQYLPSGETSMILIVSPFVVTCERFRM